jgi:hypothetical protein
MNDLVCVLPVCNRDSALMRKNLQWQHELGGSRNFKAVCVIDAGVPDAVAADILTLARSVFSSVYRFDYPRPRIERWPYAPNQAFQQTAYFMRTLHAPWLWLEADAIPLKAGWMDALNREYVAAGKPFMGAIVLGLGHCNGVAIYPSNAAQLMPRAMAATDRAWDVVMKPEMVATCHNASRLIQHAWGRVGGSLHPTIGDSPSFQNPSHLAEIQSDAVLFHRCKDGSLIDMLRGTKSSPEPTAITQERTTDIFIRTFKKDAAWLDWSLRSINKFCKGYRNVIIICPNEDQDSIRPIAKFHGYEVQGVHNNPAFGYLEQQVTKLCADQFSKADYFLFVDSDCFFLKPNTPADWFKDGKIVHLITPWANVGDAVMWKETTGKALGWAVQFETMRRLPLLIPSSVIKNCREYIERRHGKPIRDYVLEQEKLSEFNCIGSFAMKHQPGEFIFLDTTKNPLPEAIAVQRWSWGGLTEQIKIEMKKALE